MSFSSIIYKNFFYNIKKFLSLYFVNTLIVSLLFIFGSLMFNSSVSSEAGGTTLGELINISLLGLVLFAIVFITYTNISFLKYRGKEFGMYITLGMTRKDLTKLIFIENVGIVLTSIGSGLIVGALFSRLFYMGLNKMMPLNPIKYELNWESFALSAGIFIAIFLCNFIFNVIHVRRISAIDALKSSSKKEIGSSSVVVGIVSLILFAIAAYCLPKALLKEMFADQSYFIGIFIGITLVTPYFIIGTFISVMKWLVSKNKKLYHRNILVLSNLAHRFASYKSTLYMVTLLVGGAVFFVGLTYSFYAASEEAVKADNPYNVMFVESDNMNHINQDEVLATIGDKLKYSTLEYIELQEFIKDKDGFIYRSERSSVVSESNYNKHMGTTYDVKKDDALNVRVYEENVVYQQPDTILTNFNSEKIDTIQLKASENDWIITKEDFQSTLQNETSFSFKKENMKEIEAAFSNYRSTSEYYTGKAMIVDDAVYETMKATVPADQMKKLHFIKGDISDSTFKALLTKLKEKNGLSEDAWQKGTLFGAKGDDEKAMIEDYRPVYVDELIDLQIENNGMNFFAMTFLGILFVLAAGIVLYYKVLTDIEEEKERVKSLNRIGITEKELKAVISKDLAITFFLPTLFGTGLGMYYIYVMASNMETMSTLLQKASLIGIIYFIIQTALYMISRRKYVNEIMQ